MQRYMSGFCTYRVIASSRFEISLLNMFSIPALIIGGIVESNMIPREMAMSPLVGLLQSLQILMAFSIAHAYSQNALTIFDERVKVRRLRG